MKRRSAWTLKKELTVWIVLVALCLVLFAGGLHLRSYRGQQELAQREAYMMQDDSRKRLATHCEQHGVPQALSTSELYPRDDWDGEWTQPEEYTIDLHEPGEISVEVDIRCESPALYTPVESRAELGTAPSTGAHFCAVNYESGSVPDWWEFWK